VEGGGEKKVICSLCKYKNPICRCPTVQSTFTHLLTELPSAQLTELLVEIQSQSKFISSVFHFVSRLKNSSSHLIVVLASYVF
jgi:hypothetical protein